MYHAPVKTLLLTWSDRGTGVVPAGGETRPRATDRGPVLRLLDQDESRGRYDAAWVLTTSAGVDAAEPLARDMRRTVPVVRIRAVDVADPSDYNAVFRSVTGTLAAL